MTVDTANPSVRRGPADPRPRPRGDARAVVSTAIGGLTATPIAVGPTGPEVLSRELGRTVLRAPQPLEGPVRLQPRNPGRWHHPRQPAHRAARVASPKRSGVRALSPPERARARSASARLGQ